MNYFLTLSIHKIDWYIDYSIFNMKKTSKTQTSHSIL